ncbi:MAG TPA: hypothetical protein VEW05_14515 [Candidatus Polarisedimenticolia bacterium]|nr:hypothetical protein [Candidatus Polarisedimenticolia bacterium]
MLLLYFFAHLSNLNRRRFSGSDRLQNAAWIVLLPGFASAIHSYASIVLLPPLAAFVLLRRSGHMHEWTTRAGVALSLLIVIAGVLCVWKIAPMRMKIPENATI